MMLDGGMTRDDVEYWRPVWGWADCYEVSSWGRVRSLTRKAADGRTIHGRIMRQTKVGKYGYRAVALNWNGQRTVRAVHRLVAAAFVPRPPWAEEVCHNDGDPSNNHAANLRWDTHAANMADAQRHLDEARRG